MPKKRKVQQRFVADINPHDVLPSSSSSTSSAQPPSSAAAHWPDHHGYPDQGGGLPHRQLTIITGCTRDHGHSPSEAPDPSDQGTQPNDQRAMDKRASATARPIRKSKPGTRVPTRFVNVDDTAFCNHNDEAGEPQKMTAGTRSALLHSARRSAQLDKAEAKAKGNFLMKSTFGAVTTYQYTGSTGPPQPVLRVVDENYYRSHAQAASKAAPKGSSSSSRGP